MVGVIPGRGQHKAVGETWVLRSIPGFAALATVCVFTNLSCYWTVLSGHECKEK